MDGLLQDLRYALRAIRRAPVFSAIAIGCLAIGISVNVAAFSIVDALIYRDLPGVVKQRQLSALAFSSEYKWGRGGAQVSTLDWEVIKGRIEGFSSSGVTGNAAVSLTVAGEPTAVRADFVSGSYFATLGTRPVAGRLINEADDRPGAPPVVVISHDLWRREFELRPDVVGRALRVGGVSFTIVGVAPQGYVGLYPGELSADPRWGAPYVMIPLSAAGLVRAESRYATREAALDDEWLRFVGRRVEGMSTSRIEAQANVAAAAISAAYPRQRVKTQAKVRDASMAPTADLLAATASVMAVPFLILLVACANLANQLLARAVQRGREIAVRLSLGASRRRLVRMLLVEAMLIALVAGVLALGIARVLTDVISTQVLVMPFHIPIDARAAVFTLGVALVTAVAFGLAPSLRAASLDLAQSMKEGGAAGGLGRSRLRNALVVVQVAASVALLAVAGVFTRAAEKSRVAEGGANADRLMTIALDLDLAGYDSVRGRAFQSVAMDRLRALPGVEAVALAPFGPVNSMRDDRITIAGDPPERERYMEVARVSGDWFGAYAMRPTAGRLFNPTERGDIAVVNEAVARRLWPGENAVGRTMMIGERESRRAVTVIGVVPAAKRDPRDAQPHSIITVPAAPGEYSSRGRIYLRTAGSAAAMRDAVRSAVRELDPVVPMPTVMTLGESVAEVVSGVGQIGIGAAAMGVIAMLLASLGLFAVLAFIVEQRRYEIGVRIALGAQPRNVTGMILRQSLSLTGAGIVAGALLAMAGVTVLRGMLFGLPPIDVVAFGASTALIFTVAVLSSVVPARRAARVDPMVVLKAD